MSIYQNWSLTILQHAVSADKKASNLKTEGGEENNVTERAEEEDEEAAGEDEEGADDVKKEVDDVEVRDSNSRCSTREKQKNL